MGAAFGAGAAATAAREVSWMCAGAAEVSEGAGPLRKGRRVSFSIECSFQTAKMVPGSTSTDNRRFEPLRAAVLSAFHEQEIHFVSRRSAAYAHVCASLTTRCASKKTGAFSLLG